METRPEGAAPRSPGAYGARPSPCRRGGYGRAAVGVEADGEGRADALPVVGAAEVKEALEVGAATLGVGVGGHDEGDIKEGIRPEAPERRASGMGVCSVECSGRIARCVA